MAVEEHGAGRQLFRFRAWPQPWPFAAVAALAFGVLAAAAAGDGAVGVAAVLGSVALVIAGWITLDCGVALAAIERAVVEASASAAAAEVREVRRVERGAA
jgi:hypothetical protein